jgi:signal transduction histidine kinase
VKISEFLIYILYLGGTNDDCTRSVVTLVVLIFYQICFFKKNFDRLIRISNFISNHHLMKKISFKVSARTARLIGQENFAQAEGAIIELVKNSYDADAKKCLVVFDIPFEDIPKKISKNDYLSYFEYSNFQPNFYILNKTSYLLKKNLDVEAKDLLRAFFFQFNSIYIVDNGDGMTDDIIENHWMQIGTSNKRDNITSNDGRIQTGAKGIGRFALDRLGVISEMWTLSKFNKKNNIGYYWRMDWKQFERENSILSEIEADLIPKLNLNLNSFLKENFGKNNRINNYLSKTDFSSGTIIKISNLKDVWGEIELAKLFNNLEALIPPKELKIPFDVNLYYLQEEENLFGSVETAFFNDFDYKIHSTFNADDLTIDFKITRNELDLDLINRNFSNVLRDVKHPYDLETLERKSFEYSKSVSEVLRWEDSEKSQELLKEVGNFNFLFQYLKISNPKQEGGYPYKDIIPNERKNILDRFGGIKIYRDSFRVRPYGENGNDWLELGRRRTKSPAGAGQRIGDWRANAKSTAGIITISRVSNPKLVDKSDRGSLVENQAFFTLKKILIGIIHEFEVDRTKILNKFYLEIQKRKKAEEEAKIERRVKELADKMFEDRLKEKKIESNLNTQKSNRNTKQDSDKKEDIENLLRKSFEEFSSNDDNAEIAQIRKLASLGLVVSSFAHELKKIRNNTVEINDLDDKFQSLFKIISKNSSDDLLIYQDGIDIIELLKRDSKRIEHWINYSLTSIKKDKRKRERLIFNTYFFSLKNSWEQVLNEKNVKLNIVPFENQSYNFRAFEMDMDTIFSNLITNSLDAFKGKSVKNKHITISYKILEDVVDITYEDNGKGLSNVYKNSKEDIFLPFETSKKDKNGDNLGTGLGMYLVKNVVSDNNGQIILLDKLDGFKLKIIFPLRKK